MVKMGTKEKGGKIGKNKRKLQKVKLLSWRTRNTFKFDAYFSDQLGISCNK